MKKQSEYNKKVIQEKVKYQKMFAKEISRVFNYFHSFDSYEVRKNITKDYINMEEKKNLETKVMDALNAVFQEATELGCNVFQQMVSLTFEKNGCMLFITMFFKYDNVILRIYSEEDKRVFDSKKRLG